MGEEKQEEAKAETKVEEKKEEKPTEEKKDEKPAEEKKDEKPAEEKKEEAAPSPPPPIILSVQMHCVGCAKKIERSIWKCKGVEGVEIDMEQNKVTVKGAVDPQALCTRIQKKTMRSAKVLSPLPPAEGEATNPEAPPPPPQVIGVATVELLVNMHCEACAQQLRRRILKMRGVQAVETELTAKKVTVTGTMDAEQLVKYIYRKTRKLALVIPPPPPPPAKEEEKKEEAEKKPEEKPAEEKKEEKVEEKKEKAPQEQAATDGEKAGGEEKKKEGEGETAAITEDDMAKKLAYMYGGGMINYRPMYGGGVMNYGPMYGGGLMNYGNGMMNYGYGAGVVNEEEIARRMVPWRPLYIAEPPLPPPPPSQMFSDENPNACSIS